jgi:hypothetical protein
VFFELNFWIWNFFLFVCLDWKVFLFRNPVLPLGNTRGEILRPPRGRVSQTIVFSYKEIGGIISTIHRKMFLFLSTEYLDWNILFFRGFVYKIYLWFLCCGALWCAEYNLLVVWGSRLRKWDLFIGAISPSGLLQMNQLSICQLRPIGQMYHTSTDHSLHISATHSQLQ